MATINPFNKIKRKYQENVFITKRGEKFVESTPSTDRILLANGTDLLLRANETDYVLLAESYS